MSDAETGLIEEEEANHSSEDLLTEPGEVMDQEGELTYCQHQQEHH